MADEVKQPPAPGAAATEEKKVEKKQGPTDDKGKPIMHVKVYSPYKLYVDETAYSITAENDTGPFDILPRHKNFMTLVNACVLDIDTLNGKKKIRINRAVMHVKADEVTVFLDV